MSTYRTLGNVVDLMGSIVLLGPTSWQGWQAFTNVLPAYPCWATMPFL